jgi:hypothetical protein
MPKMSQKQFDEAQKKLGVEPVPSPNKNSSSHAKTPRAPKPRDWQKSWLDINEEVQRSRRDAEEADKNKKKQQLYQRFPNKSPKAT